MRKSISYELFAGRLRGPDAIRKILDSPRPSRPGKLSRGRKQQSYIKGVHNGNFFRIKIPPKENAFRVPKLPLSPQNIVPQPFKNPPPRAQVSSSNASTNSKNASSSKRTLWWKVADWLKANWSILVLNFGSICTLTGFTRSDVLELRSLSITGSLSSVVFLLTRKEVLWPSVVWSSLFATVNGVKIYQILHERNAEVHMSEEQEKVFVEHFMPHGITPKQFERIEAKAECFRLKKGEFLLRTGDRLDQLYLIVEGSTRAHILGRSLTAISSNPQTRGDHVEGGDSGAWVGEMAFLDQFWDKEQNNSNSNKAKNSVQETNSGEVPGTPKLPRKKRENAIYSIVAAEDCTVMRWNFEDMENLMASSTDLRASMTRAMTSALVGKVVNLTISRTTRGLPNWSAWLSDWRRNDGASVTVKNMQRLPEDLGQAKSAEDSNKLPLDPELLR